jgi:hypothetical protein
VHIVVVQVQVPAAALVVVVAAVQVVLGISIHGIHTQIVSVKPVTTIQVQDSVSNAIRVRRRVIRLYATATRQRVNGTSTITSLQDVRVKQLK